MGWTPVWHGVCSPLQRWIHRIFVTEDAGGTHEVDEVDGAGTRGIYGGRDLRIFPGCSRAGAGQEAGAPAEEGREPAGPRPGPRAEAPGAAQGAGRTAAAARA